MPSSLLNSIIKGRKVGCFEDERDELINYETVSLGYSLIMIILSIDLILLRGNLFPFLKGFYKTSPLDIIIPMSIINFYIGFRLCLNGAISGSSQIISVILAIGWPSIAIDRIFDWLVSITKSTLLAWVGNGLWVISFFITYFILNSAYKQFLHRYASITSEE